MCEVPLTKSGPSSALGAKSVAAADVITKGPSPEENQIVAPFVGSCKAHGAFPRSHQQAFARSLCDEMRGTRRYAGIALRLSAFRAACFCKRRPGLPGSRQWAT